MTARAVATLATLAALAGCGFPALPTVGTDADPTSDGPADAPVDAPPDTASPDTPDDAPVDAAVDAPIDAPSCSTGETRCAANDVETCQAGSWSTTATCANLCDHGACVTPPSCSGGATTCGVGGTEPCCAALPVPGGTFARSFDGVSAGYTDDRYQATISGYHLDRFEVTVARFQEFVAAYPLGRPSDGAGRNPHDATDPGWVPAWTALLPASQAALAASLACETVTSQAPGDPVRCVSWYVAQAFCIWDGGRLPSEAEWNYAAAGGAQQRVYPWSSPPTSTLLDGAHAIYQTAAPQRPGTAAAGAGRWGHADLAGNVWEWVLDGYISPYPSTACVDCAVHTASSANVVRGGSYLDAPGTVLVSRRGAQAPTSTTRTTGFRCARDPIP
ncbi:MAG: SUMF1/EgtB/PvdO family nonheme iron enzyme [Kofleriaceae bacterium]